MHHHVDLEANLVIAGTAHYVVGGRRVDVNAGSLLWLLPGQEHILIGNSSGFRVWVVVWSQTFLAELGWSALVADLTAQPQPLVRRLCGRWPRSIAATCGLLACGAPDAREHPGLATDDVRVVTDGFHFLLSLHRAAWDAAGISSAPAMLPLHSAVASALALLRDHHGNLSLTALAKRVGLSGDRLRRLFREQVGTGLPAYRNHLRLERFATLAEASTEHLDALASDAGFGSYAQFSRAYQARFGRAPGRHRREVPPVR